ncbi:hypothetical protein, partial [Rosistilla oblonga]|uniref:hypothetical protein n=1 Tax=Rosistilla oblonga TaxID=2527990 RepID=UPI003A97F4A9
IVSVPYQWRRGQCIWHKQDPVDETKLAGWLGEPDRSQIIDDAGVRRMVATYLFDDPGDRTVDPESPRFASATQALTLHN